MQTRTAPEVPAPVPPPTEPPGRSRRGRWRRFWHRDWWFRDRKAWGRVGIASAAGVLLSFAFPPLDLGPLALVALVPLLWTWREATAKRAFVYGFFFGMVFAAFLISWIFYFGVVGYFPLMLVAGAFFGAPGALIVTFARFGVRSPLIPAATFTLFEQFHGRFPFGGLTWGDFGTALHDFPVARSLASWGGVALVTFLVVLCNALVFDALVDLRERRVRSLAWAGAGLAALVVVSAVGYATRFEPTPAATLRIATLQGNDIEGDLTPEQIYQLRYLNESHFGLAEQLEGPYDLIVFPESALDADPEQDLVLRDRIASIGAAHDSYVLVNALQPTGEDCQLGLRTDPNAEPCRSYNTNLLYEPDGTLQGTDAKNHLVPFGEYVPLRDTLKWVEELNQIPYDYEQGDDTTVFDVRGTGVGTIICFESGFGRLTRDYVRNGAEVIVVTTNNASYRRSANSDQHIAQSQMRAAETGRPVIHAAISGKTAWIDADGVVYETTELFENETVIGDVTGMTGQTPYVRYGEWVTWASGLGLIAAAAYGRWRIWPHRSTASARS